jgi:hypothetical protein
MKRRLTFISIFALILTLVPLSVSAEPLNVVPPAVGDTIDGLPEKSAQMGALGLSRAADAGGLRLSEAVTAPIPFSLVGVELPDGVEDVLVRTSADGRAWTEWNELEYDPQEGPDLDGPEGRDAKRGTDPLWVGEARYVQVAVDGGSPEDVIVHVIDGTGLSRSLPGRAADVVRAIVARSTVTATATELTQPKVVTRAEWGANESWRGSPRSADRVRYGVVHHTATTNDYSRADAPKIVNSIYRYHTQSLGWRDIGYNLLVDRYGVIYEGRFGGMTNRIIGAHAAGFNTGSFGISLIGNMEVGAVPAAGYDAMIEAIAWQFAAYDLDPDARITVTSAGSNKYPKGTEVRLNTLIGHRDVGQTACPGKNLYPRLGDMRTQAGAKKSTYPLGVGLAPIIDFSGSYVDTVGTTHEAAISRIRALEITVGCDVDKHLFCPTSEVTRGQMATFIGRALNVAPVEFSDVFPDVPDSHTHAPMINALGVRGILSTDRNGNFNPNEPITRSEMALFLQRALELARIDGQRFDDVPATNRTHGPSINAIAEAGITRGCTPDGRLFCPDDGVTRGQMASFLIRAFDDGSAVAEADEEPVAELVDVDDEGGDASVEG